MGERLSQEQRAAIRQRIEAATPGKWEWVEVDDNYYLSGWDGQVPVLKGQIGGQSYGWVDVGNGDARFIAAARTDIPLLLADLKDAETQAELIRSAFYIETEKRARAEAEARSLAGARDFWREQWDDVLRQIGEWVEQGVSRPDMAALLKDTALSPVKRAPETDLDKAPIDLTKD